MTNRFVPTFGQRPAPIGTMLSTPSTEVADALAGCGFDWLFLDTEHGTLDVRDVVKLLAIVQDRVPALVRVPDTGEVAIKKVLDAGADGIIVPQVNSAEIARNVVLYAKYPPVGCRSVGIGRAHAYGASFGEYVETANASTSVVIQIEHRDAVEKVEEILQVPGIDAVFIGPYDLSGSLGCIGEVSNPVVTQAIDRVRAACRKAQMPVGIFAANAPTAQRLMEDGYDFINIGIDIALLGAAARSLLKEVHLPNP